MMRGRTARCLACLTLAAGGLARMAFAAPGGTAAGTTPTTARPDEPPSGVAGDDQPPAKNSVLELQLRLKTLETQVAEQKALLEAVAAQPGTGVGDAVNEELGQGEPKLQLYGFMDAGLMRWMPRGDSQSGIFPSTGTSFVSGNTNLYFDARPEPHWRALVETRFSLLPHGDYRYSSLGPVARTDTHVFDTTSTSGRDVVQWGGVFLERAVMEWKANDAFAVQAGYFFTPWGIWNVDHGTPTLIALFQPAFLVQEVVPRRQTGVQILGAIAHPPWELGYRLFVSNGRTTTLFDLTDDKAVGGRLFIRRTGEVHLTVGSSGYWGRSEDEQKSIVIGEANSLSIARTRTYALTEWIAGGDVSINWHGLRLRWEGVVSHTQYDAGHYEPALGIPGATNPNRYGLFTYGILAYRLGRWVEPFIYVESGDTRRRSQVLPDKGQAYSVGLNVHFSPSAQLKTQWVEASFENFAGSYRAGLLTSRLVLAF